jgi:hypothetical protein
LISTSYAPDSKRYKIPYQPSLFEQDAPQFDKTKTSVNGKIFILEKDKSGDGRINIDDLEWEYLNCDGDFRSKEVTKLRDEADFIITNPPFSLFREFLAWIIEGGKRFAVIGNMNAITYKEVFPLIKNNQIWLGATGNGNDMVFGVPEGAKVDDKDRQKAARLGYVGNYTRLGNSCWFTSIEHGRRHQPLSLMSMAEIMERRYGNETDWPMPDLIIIDGGKGQLSQAMKILQEIGRKDIPVVGLAKARTESDFQKAEVESTEERFFLPARQNPVIFKHNAEALHILVGIRDEAHRFAITYHRKLREGTSLESELDYVVGLGEKRKKTLLTQFNSIDEIRMAEPGEIAKLKGFNRVLAERIILQLNDSEEEEIEPEA